MPMNKDQLIATFREYVADIRHANDKVARAITYGLARGYLRGLSDGGQIGQAEHDSLMDEVAIAWEISNQGEAKAK